MRKKTTAQRKATSFRLSPQSQQILRGVSRGIGISQTAVLELALRQLFFAGPDAVKKMLAEWEASRREWEEASRQEASNELP